MTGPRIDSPHDRADRLAAWILRWPLGVALVGLCLAQVATWLPHYLTWPFFIDHEVFANLALQWESGRAPYRDSLGNNFPGTIYLFWLIGKVFGWGRTAPFFAADAALLVAFGGVMIAWSAIVLRRALPGIVGYAAFLSYYLNLDNSLVAQRDWHGPALTVASIMVLECSTRGPAVALSSVLAALGFVTRPQVVLFFPAVALAILERAGRSKASRRTVTLRVSAWLLGFGLFVAVGFLPLLASGVADDFARSIRLVAYGGSYNQVSAPRIIRQLVLQAEHLEYLVIPASVLLLAWKRGDEVDEDPAGLLNPTATVWLTALLGAWFYRPLSPVPWPYLAHPLVLLGSVNIAVLTASLLRGAVPPAFRLVTILLVLVGSGVSLRPRYCSVGRSLEAIRSWKDPAVPPRAPLGFLERIETPTQQAYPWEDYREVLEYLRRSPAETQLANLLRTAPALVGPTGRRSALPAESLAWLVVRPEDMDGFVRAIEQAREDTRVVWAPFEETQDDRYRLAWAVRRIAPVVRRRFRREARFGVIEVWRRTTDPQR